MPPLENVAKRPLILATGDSYTYGAEVSEAETWPAYLQGLLRVTVANGGVLCFITDDLRRNELSRSVGFEKPYFVREGSKLALRHVPVPPPYCVVRAKRAWKGSTPSTRFRRRAARTP